MTHLLPLVVGLLAGCTDKGSDTASVCCSGGDSASGGDSGAAGVTATPWDLVPLPVVSESLSGVRSAGKVFRASGTDFVYIVNSDGAETHILTQAYVQPEGDYCIGDPGGGGAQSYQDCAFTRWTAGRITTTESKAVCLDDVEDVLYFVKPDGAKVETAGTSRAGESWTTYHRIYRNRTVDKEEGDHLEGPCAASAGRFAMSSPEEVLLMDMSATNPRIAQRISYPGGLIDLQWVGQSKWLLAHGKDGSVWAIDSETGEKAGNLAPAGDAAAIAVDPVREAVWIARAGDGRLVRVKMTDNGAGTPAIVDNCGAVEQLAVDYRTGAVHALTACPGSPSGWQIVVAGPEGIHAIQQLDDTPLALIPPGNMGHVGAIVQTEPTRDTAGAEIPAEVQLRVWHADDPADSRPPLNMWIVTTLEEPFSANPKACTPEENPNDNFQDLLDQLRENIPLLRDMGFPVAVGVTWEFYNNVTVCHEESIFDELADAGFVLGNMIHDKPCYACTDGEVEGQEYVDQCAPNSMYYQQPTSTNACWPTIVEVDETTGQRSVVPNPDYCAVGDQQCWFDWTNRKQLDVDRALPGGNQFIFGADRHRLWGWEYIQGGYRVYDRADGSRGYTITMFQGNWVYSDITDTEDPRAKDPAPWHPELLGTSWFPAVVDDWEQDSVFSELAYFPGNSVAVTRLYDWQVTDMSLVSLFDEANTAYYGPLVLEENDLDVLLGLVAQPLAHRTERPGTFYFHLPDLTG
ncbi:MAG: hypothetical protein D6798_10730, partial [Deltaproteobacteria bacterium]